MGAILKRREMNVLFLCTGNSARSIMAEALLNRWGKGKFKAYSAGSHPKGMIHTKALEILSHDGFNTGFYRSKSWDEFAVKDAPVMDFVITVCDRAAGEVCPVWPGQPMTAHWGIEDPDKPGIADHQLLMAFRHAFRELDHRIRIFAALPLDKLEKHSLQKHLDDIGQTFQKAV
jgi:arsenate reductase